MEPLARGDSQHNADKKAAAANANKMGSKTSGRFQTFHLSIGIETSLFVPFLKKDWNAVFLPISFFRF
jgi:hypothetical protein